MLAAGLGIAGCGTPGAPQPPSLNLPDPVTDLSAVRTGNQVHVSWTMPKRNTDKLPLQSNINVHICRREASNACAVVGDMDLAPAASGSFAETVPPTIAEGALRPVSYFVELKNRNGRSAGLSNPAIILAGQAPAAVSGLAAEVRKAGVVLRWTPDNSTTAVRLHRKLLTTPAATPHDGQRPPPPEPIEQSLLVEGGPANSGRALDKSILFGQTYEYRAQRVARAQVEGQALELAGEISAPVRVQALDVFPPAVPTGLAAVANAPAAGTEASVDLSWQPNAELDLAGYELYRRESETPWQRISPQQPVVAPAFHDAHVLPGHTYIYAVSSVDQGGHESGRSAEAQETVPNP